MKSNSNIIEEKWDANWCNMYSKYFHDYNVEKNLKKIK